MAAQSSMLHVRIDSDLKAQASDALAAMGLTTSDAVRLLFHRVVADQAFPFDLKVPTAATRAAMAEAQSMIELGGVRFSSAQPLIDALDGGA
jgi:DNA-damage-inducible protein J